MGINKQTIATLRNIFHSILGFTLAYCLCNSTGVWDFNNEASRVFVSIVAGFFTGAVIGVGIEYFQNVALKQVFNEMDVLRTIIGGIIGGLVQRPNIEFISKWMLMFCGIVCLAELVRIFRAKK